MKREKGIDFLLDTVRRYRGPPFTLLLAGPPVAVDEQGIEAIDRQTPVEVVHEFGFISEPEPYFRAADAVVLPYQRQYGGERASQLFEEACSALRPVIVPDPGVLGRLTRRWGLGETYEQGSTRSLADVLARFARGELSFSIETMREYSQTHSYEQAARRMCDIYENRCSSAATATDEA
jgi:glycosyltransferase involved in cell wall biosynthesis